MATKVKGIFKGLRYISQIFDTKEHEMQIGYPTDVKHVAHIGWDGTFANSPSWMNEFRSAPISTLGAEALADQSPSRFPSQGFSRSVGGTQDSPALELLQRPALKPKRRSSTADAPNRSPGAPRHPRCEKSIGGVPVDPRTSPGHAGEDGNSHNAPAESTSRDLPMIPKAVRKKKPKAGGGADGGEGSSRSAKSRAKASLPDGGGVGKERKAEDPLVVSSPGTGEGV